jgi:hypothetical protein
LLAWRTPVTSDELTSSAERFTEESDASASTHDKRGHGPSISAAVAGAAKSTAATSSTVLSTGVRAMLGIN